MCGIVRGTVRTALIVALVGGAAVVIAGPHRIHAMVHQARNSVNAAIDKTIDDPVALREQLRSLEAQYPERIGEVRGDLSEVSEQVASLERDLKVSQRVIELADADLGRIQGLLTRAEDARNTDGFSVVKVSFDNRTLDLDDAYAEANRISQVRSAYATRSGELERDLGYLNQQQSRLGELLTTLETERAQFQAQLWQLDRQIDAISRNDRLIEVMQDREQTIEKHSRYRVASLEQLQGRLAEIRTKQEATLEGLGRQQNTTSYEDRAKIDLDARSGKAVLVVPPSSYTVTPPSITIDEDDCDDAPARGKVASR
ncbi:MAG: hypothetical protein RBS39_10000 [Phycisphaerales bacterium]|jgi:predicted RNase H-like nuclease (RuvC/YqgF family)|nr:hypothetical protein [Phycisphaerales bacterium]